MKTRSLFFLALLTLASCRDNRSSLEVQMVCMPTKTCAFKDTCDAQYIGYPTIDPMVTSNMWLFLQVANQLPNNKDDAARRLNTNDIHVDEVAIKYEGIGLAQDVHILPNYFVPANGTAVISVEAIRNVGSNQATLRTYGAGAISGRDMIANIRLRGYTDDGARFETGEFPLGIRVFPGGLPADPCAAGDLACPHAGIEPVACGSI